MQYFKITANTQQTLIAAIGLDVPIELMPKGKPEQWGSYDWFFVISVTASTLFVVGMLCYEKFFDN